MQCKKPNPYRLGFLLCGPERLTSSLWTGKSSLRRLALDEIDGGSTHWTLLIVST